MALTNVPTTAAEEFQLRSRSPVERVRHVLHTRPWVGPAIVLIVTCGVFAVLAANFFTAGNLSLVVQQATITAALALGQGMIIITAGVDLSVGAVMVCASLVMAQLASNHVPGFIAFLAGCVFGVAAGGANGLLVTRFRMPPFIVTLGTLSVFTAISLEITSGQTIAATSMGSFLNWTSNTVSIGSFVITYGMGVVAVLFAVLMYALNLTAWGRHVYAVGDNREAAKLTGIRTNRVLFSVYVVAGLVFAITGWVLIGRTGVASPSNGATANLDSITAVVIGGISLFGGRGSLIGAVLGALIVQVFYNGLFLYGVSPSYQEMAIGLLVLLAVGIDQWIKRVRT
jgi:fructose transport system permease protein